MLDAVLGRMADLGLIRDPARAQCNIFVRLDNVLANVFEDDDHYYYLRIAQAYDLEQEYRIAQAVADLAGRFVPQPLAFFRVGQISCIVVEGIDFRVVTRAALMNADPGESVIRELLEYLEYVGPARTDASACAQVAELRVAMDERYRGTDHEALWAKVVAKTDVASLAALPSQPQHGDFVPNNFGLRGDRLVIFDWEDYGRIDVPGFDLAVLLGSVVDFEPRRLRTIRDDLLRSAERPAVRWFPNACRAAGVEVGALLRALPFHLSLFMWLKDRYSPAIRLKVNRAIVGLL